MLLAKKLVFRGFHRRLENRSAELISIRYQKQPMVHECS